METKPTKQMVGATFIRIELKILGSKALSVDSLPLIRINPNTTINIPAANKIKLTLSNAKFFLSIYLQFYYRLYLVQHALEGMIAKICKEDETDSLFVFYNLV